MAWLSNTRLEYFGIAFCPGRLLRGGSRPGGDRDTMSSIGEVVPDFMEHTHVSFRCACSRDILKRTDLMSVQVDSVQKTDTNVIINRIQDDDWHLGYVAFFW